MPVRTLLAAALAGAVWLVYAPVLDFDFVSLDDPLYVTANEPVLRGLEPGSVAWAFTSALGANWLPLTFLSHMADVEWFGLDPGAHHRTNLLLHVLATLTLFGALVSMTGRALPSALVAAGFALHPLRVESVAWVTERKDVLSGVFAFATIAAHAGFARHGGAARRLTVAAALLAGLLSKAMLVTLPFVLLLLDLWPLGRLRAREGHPVEGWLERRSAAVRPGRYRSATLPELVREKLPLFALVALVAAVTFVVQQEGGAMVVAGHVPLPERLANAVYSVARYLELQLWPSGLSVQVPHPFLPDDGGRGISWLALAGAGALVVGMIVVAARAGGAVGVGVAWFLGMLVPVIGLVQVGPQGLADRYTYLPSVGLLLAIVWPVADAARRRGRAAERAATAVGVAVVVALAVACTRQLPAWRSGTALFEHAVAVDPGNLLARFGLARAYRGAGRLDEAEAQYRAALAVRPRSARAHNGLGAVLRVRGDVSAAALHFELALEAEPELTLALGQLASLRRAEGDFAAADALYVRALQLEPGSIPFALGQAASWREQGRLDEAEAGYRRVIAREPAHRPAVRSLARLLNDRGRPGEARQVLADYLAQRPDDAAVRGQWEALREAR